MLRPVPDESSIEEHTRELLKRADAKGRFPTPVDDIVLAAGLTQPKDSLLSNLVIDQAPPHLRRAMRKLSGKVRAVLDRREREVHIDPTVHNAGRIAFKKLHEVSHDIFPWQNELGFADDDATLAPSVKSLFEQEANIGASNLLFQHDYFDDVAGQYAVGQAAVLELSNMIGASIHATFRRFVSTHKTVMAGVVLDMSPCGQPPVSYRRYEVLTSSGWRKQFGDQLWPRILHPQPYAFVTRAEEAHLTGDVVRADFVFPNLRNESVGLSVELYCNQHNIFALIWKPRRETLKRKRKLILPDAATA
jgi:hypothetical protein